MSRMISGFLLAGYLMRCRPHPAITLFSSTRFSSVESAADFCLVSAPSRTTTSRKSSLLQPNQSVSRLLTTDKPLI